MFDYMFSSDIFVDDMRRQTQLLVDHLELHPPGPRAIVTDSPEAHATMLRLHRSFAEAPTRLEIIQPARTAGHWNVAHIQQAWLSQLHRPVRFHNTVVIGDVDGLVEGFRRRSIPHVVDGTLSFRRLFIGIDRDRIDVYDPAFDAGLRIEILPFSDFPVEAPAGADDGGEGAPRVVRVLSRSFLVDDLDGTVKALDTTLGWQPSSPVHFLSGDGVQRVVYGFRHPRSAGLELLQPLAPGTEAGRFLAHHGPGAYTTTFLAAGIEHWVDRLAASGIQARRVRDHEEYGARVIVDPGPMGPIRVELVAADPRQRGRSGRE